MDAAPRGRRQRATLSDPVTLDAADAVLGWRYWQLPAGERQLRSVTHRRVVWRTGSAHQARCLTSGHAAPSEGCACGIHAAVDLASLHAHGLCLGPEALIVGQVRLWGRVVEDGSDGGAGGGNGQYEPTGLRGEFAYPLHLCLVAGTVEDARVEEILRCLAAYGVAVTTMPASEAIGDVSAAILAFLAMSR